MGLWTGRSFCLIDLQGASCKASDEQSSALEIASLENAVRLPSCKLWLKQFDKVEVEV